MDKDQSIEMLKQNKYQLKSLHFVKYVLHKSLGIVCDWPLVKPHTLTQH